MRRHASFAVFCLLAAASSGSAQQLTMDPAAAALVFDDVRRFAGLLERLGSSRDTLAMVQSYLDAASPGLRIYAERYDVTAASLAAALADDPEAYASLTTLRERFRPHEGDLRAAFRRFGELYPAIAYPPTYFVVGHMGAGGTVRREGVLIAAERITGRPEDAIPLILHELAHFQQGKEQGAERYRAIYGDSTTLLKLALREGSAELLAELSAGRPINTAALEYVVAHEAELWAKFREEMHGSATGEWMFVRPADGRPADLGYAIGHRIAAAYYERAADKRAAVLDLLRLTDFEAFLAASGYAERFR